MPGAGRPRHELQMPAHLPFKQAPVQWPEGHEGQSTPLPAGRLM